MSKTMAPAGHITEGGFVVEPMTARQIGPSYPIIQITMPRVSRADWQRFARRTIAATPAHRGILVIRRRERLYPSGLACYRCETDLSHGRILTARPLAAIDILNTVPLLHGLVEGLVTIAQAHDCRALRVAMASGGVIVPLSATIGCPIEISGEYTIILLPPAERTVQ
ncbi:MAG: hypothetical protein ACYCZB_03745 [Acidiphilium sp.]